ncbi:hypothetical protein OpiT1DRAFT_00245 [Opitutaceae bacterium TAV1]|nr:hypothetical protein OpiT1DRAFT_00245 [Opitutaceae bacterium TAV1]
MKPPFFFSTLILLATALPASAHLSFRGRDLGSFDGTSTVSVIIDNQTVANNSGWADGTFETLADSHKVRPYRFTLAAPAAVMITVSAHAAATDQSAGGLLPGFSLYAGLPHLPPDPLDYDGSPVTLAWLASLGGTQPKHGAFDALRSFRIGNDAATATNGSFDFAALSTLAFIGYAADGGPANLGEDSGATGDGTADGQVSGSWQLPAGSYTLFVGGADHAHRENSGSGYGVAVTLRIAPPAGDAPAATHHPHSGSHGTTTR